MPLTYSALKDMLSEFGRPLLNEQANLAAPFLKSSALTIKDLATQVGTVQINNGGFSSTRGIGDGGSLPTGTQLNPLKGQYGPAIILGRADLPKSITKIASNREGIDVAKTVVKTMGADLNRTLDRSLLNAQLSSPVGTVSIGATSFPVVDPSGYREGMSVDIYNGSTLVETVVVSTIVIPASGNSTINLAAACVNALTGRTAWLCGMGPAGSRVNSLADITAASGSLHGLTSSQFIPGEENSSTATYTNEDAGALMDRVAARCGRKPTHIIVNSIGARRIANNSKDLVRFVAGGGSGKKVDEYDFEFMVDNAKVIVDDNQSSLRMDFVTKDEFYLHRFYDFEPDNDEDGMELSQTVYSYIYQVSGAFQLACKCRKAFAAFTALTA